MEVKIPSNFNVRVESGRILATISGEESLVVFDSKKIKVEVKGDAIEITPLRKVRRETNAMMRSVLKHLQNVFAGAANAYSKKLQVVYAHFPISVEVKGQTVNIKNFLGEKLPREADIVGKAQVAVSGQDITVKGPSKDGVGQTAANIIQAVRITGKDRRVFQDGIYLVK